MFFLPGFDPKTMTDDQLLEKITELNGKIVFAAAYNNGGVDMMQGMLMAIEDERMERLITAQTNYQLQNEVAIIESDPSLKNTQAATTARDPAKRVRTRPAVTRSAVPVPTRMPVLPTREPTPPKAPTHD